MLIREYAMRINVSAESSQEYADLFLEVRSKFSYVPLLPQSGRISLEDFDYSVPTLQPTPTTRNPILIALSSPCQDASITTSFESFEQLEEERKETTVCYLFAFRWIVSSAQVVVSSFRSELLGTPVVVIVAQKLSMYVVVSLFLLLVSVLIIDAVIEDERQLPLHLTVLMHSTCIDICCYLFAIAICSPYWGYPGFSAGHGDDSAGGAPRGG
ncbi:hypothetical protein F511_36696 [Dorcoceras hygrometricum]|uniref:Uncharacterized protein n=1 Tax=Dorcoceras hygrometricum TaxID=472368 RepID=A0A2Z7DC79_9LAMI|nr:hypothetical protein F511_36696 [Dorcoceras hygrometricum]